MKAQYMRNSPHLTYFVWFSCTPWYTRNVFPANWNR